MIRDLGLLVRLKARARAHRERKANILTLYYLALPFYVQGMKRAFYEAPPPFLPFPGREGKA